MKVVSSQWSVVTKSIFCLALCVLPFVICIPVEAQRGKIPRIGIVRGDRNAPAPSIKIFQQALQDLGYVEGKNIQFEYRYTEGSRDQAARIAAELVNLKVDILFSTQAIVIHAAKQATKTIPIVMAITPDPVQVGLVDSLARPGGNITGLTSLARNLSGKRLELLTEMIPRLSRVGFLTVAGSSAIKDYEDAARGLKVLLQSLQVQVPNPNLPGAFQDAVKERVHAIIVASVPGLSGHRKQIADLAIQTPPAVDVRERVSYRSWRPRVLWGQGRRNLSSRGHLRGQDLERRQAGGPAG